MFRYVVELELHDADVHSSHSTAESETHEKEYFCGGKFAMGVVGIVVMMLLWGCVMLHREGSENQQELKQTEEKDEGQGPQLGIEFRTPYKQ